VLVVSIGLSFWVQYARTMRGSTLIERNKDYVRPPGSSACRRR
jgi:peptide/nickel transport system permease protein